MVVQMKELHVYITYMNYKNVMFAWKKPDIKKYLVVDFI